ncbi:MAG: molybdate ABC transporter substrate-binding protein [Protaetiibacter sp.]
MAEVSGRRSAAALVLVAAALSGCVPGASAGEGAREQLTVYAAASLLGAFDEIATAFADEHPEIVVNPIVAEGSNTLVTQLIAGAPADVFASADESTMARAADAGLVGEATVFASNTLVIAVPAGNPARIRTPVDLAGADVTLVLCASEVPCGSASRELLTAWGVEVVPASLEQNVSAVLTKVAAGEADAGLVYRTDVQGRDDVESIVPPGAEAVVNRYPIAALTGSAHPDAAAAFVAFVAGESGQRLLAKHGFGAP